MKSLISLEKWCTEMVYGQAQINRIASLTELLHAPLDARELMNKEELLEEVEVLFSGWGGPTLDEELIKKAPNLKLYLHAGGAWKGIIGSSWFDSKVRFCSTIHLNGVPVAEYTLGFILLGLKRALPMDRWVKAHRVYPSKKTCPGAYGSTVGLVALGHAAQHLVKLLQPYDLKIIAYDPYMDPSWAKENSVALVDLDTVFRQSDVVSVHLPQNRKTKGMIEARHIHLMKESTTFINTSRGRVLKEDEVLLALKDRPDIHGVFDVAISEPPQPDSLFFSLENVTLTPHIAGSLFKECERLGNAMVGDFQRYLSGESLEFEITSEEARMLLERC